MRRDFQPLVTVAITWACTTIGILLIEAAGIIQVMAGLVCVGVIAVRFLTGRDLGAAFNRVRRDNRDQRAGRLGLVDLTVGAARAMRLAAELMPTAVGDRWLAEAESFLFEIAPVQREKIVHNYLMTAPRVVIASWADELARRVFLAVKGRNTNVKPDDGDDCAHHRRRAGHQRPLVSINNLYSEKPYDSYFTTG
jgi:hypothetical protein